MTDPTRAFRDYATRVSFNLTLSRNQIANLRNIVFELAHADMDFEKRCQAASDGGYDCGNNFIVGKRSLESMGLIEPHPRDVEERRRLDEAEKKGERGYRKYWGPSYRLTPAGEHVIELLRLAGLMPNMVAANANSKRRRTA